jgi:hypothetical protein
MCRTLRFGVLLVSSSDSRTVGRMVQSMRVREKKEEEGEKERRNISSSRIRRKSASFSAVRTISARSGPIRWRRYVLTSQGSQSTRFLRRHSAPSSSEGHLRQRRRGFDNAADKRTDLHLVAAVER